MAAQLEYITLNHFGGATLSWTAAYGTSAAEPVAAEARDLLACLLSGATIPSRYAEFLDKTPNTTKLLAAFRLKPWKNGPLSYDVHYEAAFAVEQAPVTGSACQPYCLNERLSYVEERSGTRSSWRKAFDTENAPDCPEACLAGGMAHKVLQ